MRVLAALSGGVDSAVAAALAKEAGHDVTAVHMALSSVPSATRCSSRGCCTAEDAADARQAAALLDIPFYIWDMADVFHKTVINDFLSEYRAGRTPNPCVRCNEFVKFKELLERGLELGFDAVCTGHYANLEVLADGEVKLSRGACIAKDQSYVVAVMGQTALRHVIFPLGPYKSKDEVRALAAARHLPMSNKKDSYDICFIPDGNTRGFLRRHLGDQPGTFVDPTGRVIGMHQGAYQFTVGQRRGLEIPSEGPTTAPRYVLSTNPQTNEVVVGVPELLEVNIINAAQVVLIAPSTHPGLNGVEEQSRVWVQYRAHGRSSAAKIKLDLANDSLSVHLEEPVRAVAPGQSLVIYDAQGRVLAQATITGTRRV